MVSNTTGDKKTRTVKVKGSAVGKGGAAEFGFSPEDLAGSGYSSRTGTAEKEWRKVMELAVKDPGEWYHRKVYYSQNDAPQSNSTYASIFNQQGETGAKNHGDPIPTLVREVCKLHNGKFVATYTRRAGPSDDNSKGNWMHMVYVKWVPNNNA